MSNRDRLAFSLALVTFVLCFAAFALGIYHRWPSPAPEEWQAPQFKVIP